MSRETERVTVELEYLRGMDSPEQGVFRNHAIVPDLGGKLMIAVRQLDELTDFPDNPRQTQVHLVGTPDGLEMLGKHLIALARLRTADPEPYTSMDEVRNADGGTIRLLPRRVTKLPTT